MLGLRRLSATLDEMEEKANDSQSEDEEDKMESYGEESEKVPTEDSKSNEADEDSIQLGEEGKEFTRYRRRATITRSWLETALEY